VLLNLYARLSGSLPKVWLSGRGDLVDEGEGGASWALGELARWMGWTLGEDDGEFWRGEEDLGTLEIIFEGPVLMVICACGAP